jgi:uncharacterized protein
MKKLLDHWIDEVVIGLGLCPWAAPVNDAGQLKRVISAAATPASVADVLAFHADELGHSPGTVVIGFERWVVPFRLLWDLCAIWEEVLGPELQLVVFHPDFIFDGEPHHSYAHWVNRSPMPVLQLIRSEDIMRATQLDPRRARALSKRNERVIAALSDQKRRHYFPWLAEN